MFIQLGQGVLNEPTRIWIVGSSPVKNAFIGAKQRPGGVNLCLDRYNADIWWQGRGGIGTGKLRGQILTMLEYEDLPKYLIVHVGANYIGKKKLGTLRNQLKNTE